MAKKTAAEKTWVGDIVIFIILGLILFWVPYWGANGWSSRGNLLITSYIVLPPLIILGLLHYVGKIPLSKLTKILVFLVLLLLVMWYLSFT